MLFSHLIPSKTFMIYMTPNNSTFPTTSLLVLDLGVQPYTMAREWGFHDGFTANLLLPSFSLARTRSILISIHQARDKVRCDRYHKCICNNGENSNAFKNPHSLAIVYGWTPKSRTRRLVVGKVELLGVI